MSLAPHFSIIIPSYNNLTLLKECLLSIKDQTFGHYEVWVIDNASDDGTRDFLNSLKPPFYFISERDAGIYHAMIKGIKVSRGSWLYFMGADDTLFDKNVLQSIAEATNIEFQLILGQVVFGKTGRDSKGLHSKFSNVLWIKNTVHHQGVFFSRNIFIAHSYDESYHILADYKLNLQLHRLQTKVVQTETIIAHCGDQGISKQFDWSLYKEEIRLKTEVSSVVLKPLFWVLGIAKWLIKGNKRNFTS